MLPPAHSLAWHGSWAWLALVSVINLPAPAVPINHTYMFSYNYHMKPKSFHRYISLLVHDTLHILYIYRNYGFSSCSSSQLPGRSAGPDPSCREQYLYQTTTAGVVDVVYVNIVT